MDKNGQRMRKCLAVFGLILVMILSNLGLERVFADTSEIRIVKVGFFAYPGYHEMSDDDLRSGYGVDFLNHLQRYADLNYEYVGYDKSWEEMQQMLLNGEIDLVTSARKTSEREAVFDFSEAIGTSNAQISVRAADKRYQTGEFASYDGMVVGLLKGSTRNEDLAEYAREKGFTYHAKEYDSETELTDALKSGEVDAVVSSSLRKATGERIIAQFAPEDFYVIVRKGDTDLLNEINYGIEQMNANEGNWKSQFYYKNYHESQSTELNFTQREQDYIAAVNAGTKVITAAAQPDRNPYSYVEDGKLTGIIPEYFDYLMKMAGLPYTTLVAENRGEYEQWGYDGYMDVYMDCRYDTAQSRGDGYGILTDAYMQLTVARVTRRNFAGDIHTVAMADAQGEQAIDGDIAEDAEYKTYSSREAAMEAVKDGEADACYVYTYMAEKFVNEDLEGSLTYSVLNNPEYNEYILVRDTTDHELVSILNKCIQADNSRKLNELVDKYTSYVPEKMTILQFLKMNPWFDAAMIIAAAGVVIVIFLITRNNRNVQKMADERLAYAEELKNKNAELERAIAREEKANKAKTEFLFNMSHDIRTPMNAILGFSHLAENYLTDPDKMKDYMDKIQQSGSHLLDLINNVLDMSKIETGKAVLDEEICDFIALGSSVNVSFEEMVHQKHQTFQCEYDIPYPRLWADVTKIRQIYINIISNAVKYTPEGGHISVHLSQKLSEKEGYVWVTGIVEDTGIGISETFMPHLFDRFERERNTTDIGIEGSGLGMAIVKQMVELMGGTILVESEQEKGTKVTIQIEHRIAPEEDEMQMSVSDAEKNRQISEGKRILLAEDNELNAEIAMELLTMSGFEVEHAKDGVECVNMMEKSEAGYYDLILMDIQMPNMDGYKATERIRHLQDAVKRSIPIVAMTANAFDEDKRRALDAGMDGFIAKPIDIPHMQAVLMQLIK